MKLPTGHVLEYNIGDIVYLRTDSDQSDRFVIEIGLFPSGLVIYTLRCGIEESSHYGFELVKEKDILKTFDN
jgi:hypothetical protein